MTVQQQPRSVTMTTPSERDLRFERIFDAPRETVWSAFTDPGLIHEWWGGGVTVDQMNVRVGGTWRFVADRGGASHDFKGEYLEVDPPKRLVQTAENGWNGLKTTETLEFEDLGGRTRFLQTSTFETADLLATAIKSGAEMGAKYQFSQLDGLLAKLAGGE